MDDDFEALKWLARFFIAGILIGAIVLGWIFVLGPWFSQADYQQFNNSPQHINAVAQKFSDDCQQLAETSNPTARKAIENDIYQVASTVTLGMVQMPDATRMCVNQAIYDATH